MKFIHLLLFLMICNCKQLSSEDIDSLPKVSVSFENQSQFTIESLFLHQDPLNYNETESVISSPLEPDDAIRDSIPSTLWYVTVFRKPNQDSSVLAYTTATAWNPETHPRIIYFDEQFRVSIDE